MVATAATTKGKNGKGRRRIVTARRTSAVLPSASVVSGQNAKESTTMNTSTASSVPVNGTTSHAVSSSSVNADSDLDSELHLDSGLDNKKDDTAASTAAGSSDEEKKPDLTPEQRKERFARYKVARGKVVDLEKQILLAKKEMSEACKVIYLECGKGPYNLDGAIVTAVQRDGEYFFRTRGSNDIEQI